MRVTFHGVRGSVPAPGPQTSRYGGNTSCVEVRLSDGSTLALDAGTGLRELGKKLMAEGRASPVHLFLSHTHWDHVMGLPFFAPLYDKNNHLLVYPLANEAQERFQRNIFDDIHFPVSVNDIPAKLEGMAFGPDLVIDGALTHTLWLSNDNDFIGTVTDSNHPAGIDNPNQFFVFGVDDAALPGFVHQRLFSLF